MFAEDDSPEYPSLSRGSQPDTSDSESEFSSAEPHGPCDAQGPAPDRESVGVVVQVLDHDNNHISNVTPRDTMITIAVIEEKASGQELAWYRLLTNKVFWLVAGVLLLVLVAASMILVKGKPEAAPGTLGPKSVPALEAYEDWRNFNTTVNDVSQVQRLENLIKERFPGRPQYVDLVEHFNWAKKHGFISGRSDYGIKEFEYYEVMLMGPDHDSWKHWTDPWIKLRDGPEKYLDVTLNHPSIAVAPGSVVETREIPSHVIEAFNAPGKATQAFKEIFERWESRDSSGAARLSREQVATHLGCLIFDKNFLDNGETSFASDRIQQALFDALIRNEAFRNYLSWKGVRRGGDDGCSTIVYQWYDWNDDGRPEPYIVPDRTITKRGIGALQPATKDGNVWKSYRWASLSSAAENNLGPQPERYRDSVTLGPRRNWPRLEFPDSNF